VKRSSGKITIALDVMGGDNAPGAVLHGANLYIASCPDVRFLLFGNEKKITPILNGFPRLSAVSEVFHTDNFISSDEKPSVALRRGRDSSMRLAIDAVKEERADAVVSAGNTGALMAMSKLVLRPIAGIDRPAIASIFPTRKGRCVLLDLGANVDCNSENLVQFALMGDAFAKVLLNIASPSIGLLNVGSEDNKGSEIVKSAAEELRDGSYSINFYGYVEGDDIAEGTVDIVVTDGFTGNVALKSAEGTAKLCVDTVKKSLRSSILAMIGGMLIKSAMKNAFKILDPRMHNGAMFLGLNGISVKSHGGTDSIGFANAIGVAYELAANNINKKIKDELSLSADIDKGDLPEEIEV
jgi:glycerol-3-phosphate acyltransferase PlsX